MSGKMPLTGQMVHGWRLAVAVALGGAAGVAGCGAAGSATADPYPGALLRAEVRLADEGVASVDDIRRGRVSVVQRRDGPRLSVQEFRTSARLPPPPPASDSPFRRFAAPAVAGTEAGPRVLHRALWVWNTRELLASVDARHDFLSFLDEGGYSRVFLQLPVRQGEVASAGHVPFDGRLLAPLIRAIHARAVTVEALDGDARYALPENHAGVVRTVEQVVTYNAAVEPAERFDGVRYDIEPYLLDGFDGAGRREILNGYVRVVDAVTEVARPAGLTVGVDIPFWLDGLDDDTGAAMLAELDGRLDPVLVHLFRLVDDVAVMDYRTRTDGANGVLRLVETELDVAAAFGAGVLVGLEAEYLPDEVLHSFAGDPDRGLPPDDGDVWIAVVPEGDTSASVWLVSSAAARLELQSHLRASRIRPDAVRHWRSWPPRLVPGTDLSFHDLGREAMERTADDIVAALRGHPAFRGLAFHHYGAIKELTPQR